MSIPYDPSLPITHWEGEPVDVWRRVWSVPALEAYALTDSTNDRARVWARNGAPSFSAVIASEQSAGRGRGGSAWWDAPGKSVLVSVVLPELTPAQRLLAPIGIAVAAVRALRRLSPDLPVGIKWPNDLVIGTRKLAGILCEGASDGAVIAGLGLNLGQTEEEIPEDLRELSTSLHILDGDDRARSEFLGPFLREVRILFTPPPDRISGALAHEIAELDAMKGGQVAISTGVRGRACGILSDGSLEVETANGTRVAVLVGHVEEWSPASDS